MNMTRNLFHFQIVIVVEAVGVGEGKVESVSVRVSVNQVMGMANEVGVDESVLSMYTHIQILTPKSERYRFDLYILISRLKRYFLSFRS